MKVKSIHYEIKSMVKLVLRHKKIAIQKSIKVALSTKNIIAKSRKT